jgi:hypothetical protein
MEKLLRPNKRPFADGCQGARPRTDELNRNAELLLPGALLVTIQAQLLAPFMLVDFCLAAFFD